MGASIRCVAIFLRGERCTLFALSFVIDYFNKIRWDLWLRLLVLVGVRSDEARILKVGWA